MKQKVTSKTCQHGRCLKHVADQRSFILTPSLVEEIENSCAKGPQSKYHASALLGTSPLKISSTTERWAAHQLPFVLGDMGLKLGCFLNFVVLHTLALE